MIEGFCVNWSDVPPKYHAPWILLLCGNRLDQLLDKSQPLVGSNSDFLFVGPLDTNMD